MTRPDDNIGNRIEDNIGNKIEDKTEQAPTPPKPSFNDTPDIPELGKSTLTQVETKKHP